MNEGKKDRRDPIRTIKTKNPVAKAHQTVGTGSGAHKDKKRAAKQGDVKHKNQEYAEHLEKSLLSKLAEARTEVKDKDGKVISWKDEGEWKKSEKKDPRGKVTNLSDKARKETEKLKVAEQKQYTKFRVGQRATFKNSQGQEFPVIVTAVDYDDEAVKFRRAENKPFPNGEVELEADPGWHFLTPDRSYDPNSLVKATSRQESFNPEYDDEAGMADNNLETLKRAVDGIDDVINTGDNLPEWCQEKIAVAKSMLVTVWDYMLSEKESFDIGMGQASHGKSGAGIAEASALEKFRKASAEREKKHNDAEKEMNARHARGEEDMKGSIDRLEKHVNTKEGLRDPKDNPCWKGYKPVGTKKKGGKTVPNCVPKEGWTHDSLAAELFETENTYEDRLNNLLNKRLGQ
jgi:hypothetical protein